MIPYYYALLKKEKVADLKIVLEADPEVVVDIGAGTGFFAFLFAVYAIFQVFGYDNNRKFKLTVDGADLPLETYSSIIVLNGDLGKHFPLAPGVPLNSKDLSISITAMLLRQLKKLDIKMQEAKDKGC